MDTNSPRAVQATSSPNAIACLSCRTRHLKCDAQRPVCGRCAKCRLPCTYLQSRRGRRAQNQSLTPHRKHAETRPPLPERLSGSSLPSLSDNETPVAPTAAIDASGHFLSNIHDVAPLATASIRAGDNFMCFNPSLWSPGMRDGTPLDFLGSCLSPADAPSNNSNEGENDTEHLVALYYKHFQPAHPFVIPYRFYIQQRNSLPRPLELIMQFAGSHFTDTPGQQWQQCPVSDMDSDGQSKSMLYAVQALLILAITRYGRNELEESQRALRKAVDVAVRLRLYDARTVAALSEGNRVLEQSAVRTWWELINTLAVLSVFVFDQETATALPESDLPLPCEEEHYAWGCIPTIARNQKDFLDRAFLRDDFEYSSFAYKIEACRLLMSLHALGNDWWSVDKDRIHTVHNSISNFHLSMPLKKREIVAACDGNVDEVLFAAKMLAAVATILINRPRSSLASNNSRPRTTITGRLSELSFETSMQHTIQATQAANSLADAAATRSSPCTVICHSPFYTCLIALTSTVHLPAYLQSDAKNLRESIKERLKLTTNALSRIGENWPIAKAVEVQVLDSIREVLSASRRDEAHDTIHQVQAAPLLPATSINNIHDDWLDGFLDAPIFS